MSVIVKIATQYCTQKNVDCLAGVYLIYGYLTTLFTGTLIIKHLILC
jgi:choline-glycine betaine transporter